MTDHPASRLLSKAASFVFALCFIAGTAGFVFAAAPAGAQYGGVPSLFVDPVQVEIDGTFDAVGFNCPAGSTVTISIDGFPGSLGTTIAAPDSSYALGGIDMPVGSVAGQEYDVRAGCAGGTSTFRITAVCNGGGLPVDVECPDGRTVGGIDPNASTTTTTSTVPVSTTGGIGSGNGGNDGGLGGVNLAVTGATFVEQALQIGFTFVALGGIVLLLASRRRDNTPI